MRITTKSYVVGTFLTAAEIIKQRRPGASVLISFIFYNGDGSKILRRIMIYYISTFCCSYNVTGEMVDRGEKT